MSDDVEAAKAAGLTWAEFKDGKLLVHLGKDDPWGRDGAIEFCDAPDGMPKKAGIIGVPKLYRPI